MWFFKQVGHLQPFLNSVRNDGRKIGFVPTMGALHQGHLSLVKRAKQETGFCVCSIFVNPTQFNDSNDLKKYPRTIENDIELLVAEGCDAVFFPSQTEIYPRGAKLKKTINFGQIATCLEGKSRPGHFDGVAQVVKRLLEIVEPEKLYLGLKDYQQYLIISKLVEKLDLPVKVVGCPTVREEDGLALSSRNVRLSAEDRLTALNLSKILLDTKARFKPEKVDLLNQKAQILLERVPNLKLEYFEIVDSKTLEPPGSGNFKNGVIACIAAFVGDVRLIDNVIIA